jgi:hypothetical protein
MAPDLDKISFELELIVLDLDDWGSNGLAERGNSSEPVSALAAPPIDESAPFSLIPMTGGTLRFV